MSDLYASLSFAVDVRGNRAHLLPAGEFRAGDGRPAKPVKAWRLNADLAAKIIAKWKNRKNDFLLDYEHQSLRSALNGQPAPAAGWATGEKLAWVEGEGLFATGVEWTEQAKAFLSTKQYKYMSAVLAYDPASGDVTDVISAALTNTPALDGLDAVVADLARRGSLDPGGHQNQLSKEDPMSEQVIATLNTQLAALTKELGEAKAKLEALTSAATADAAQITALTKELGEAKAKIEAAASAAADAAKKALIEEALTATGGKAPKLTPALKSWAEGQSLADLTAYLDAVAPLNVGGSQAGKDAQTAALTAEEAAFADKMGIPHADYLKAKA